MPRAQDIFPRAILGTRAKRSSALIYNALSDAAGWLRCLKLLIRGSP
jgi:hypothetical protein